MKSHSSFSDATSHLYWQLHCFGYITHTPCWPRGIPLLCVVRSRSVCIIEPTPIWLLSISVTAFKYTYIYSDMYIF